MSNPTSHDIDNPPRGANGLLWFLLLGLGLTIALVIAWRLGPVLEPTPVRVAALNPECDLRVGACTVSFADGSRVRLEIRPEGIPLITPLSLGVMVEGIQPSAAQVDFAGYDMDMGFNRTDLAPGAEPGHFEGSGMLPICIRDRMTWEARVLLQTPEGLLAAPFRFDTYRSMDIPGTQ